MSRPPPSWPFRTKKRLVDGTWREDAIFTCDECSASNERPISARAGRLDVFATVAAAVADGWVADPHRPAAECPACAQQRRARRAGDKPTKPTTTAPGEPHAMTSSTAAIAIPPAAAKPAPLPRDPTQAERQKIRTILDSHFDDAAGCWLEGYSDQRAGEECNVPWSLVTRIREAAYGPIRVDPEVTALMAAIKQARADQTKLAATLADLEKRAAAIQARQAA